MVKPIYKIYLVNINASYVSSVYQDIKNYYVVRNVITHK